MAKVQQTGRIPQRDLRYVDIYREKQIRVTVKVLVPVKEHPKVSVSLFLYALGVIRFCSTTIPNICGNIFFFKQFLVNSLKW